MQCVDETGIPFLVQKRYLPGSEIDPWLLTKILATKIFTRDWPLYYPASHFGRDVRVPSRLKRRKPILVSSSSSSLSTEHNLPFFCPFSFPLTYLPVMKLLPFCCLVLSMLPCIVKAQGNCSILFRVLVKNHAYHAKNRAIRWMRCATCSRLQHVFACWILVYHPCDKRHRLVLNDTFALMLSRD